MQEHDIPEAGLTTRLALAYAEAHYFVSIGRREWLFRVGQEAEDVERELDAGSYLFITAWNPAPRRLGAGANSAAHEQLQHRLDHAGYQTHAALGCNAHGGAAEHGSLVLDMPLSAADALAREFGQAGTLYWQRGQPVRLRMLWPRPPDWAEDPNIDWA